VIRIGYNEDKLPFAYFNVNGELVGFDINLAHALARDLGVTIEFVRFDRITVAKQLREDEFDVVMSGLVGTLERAEKMLHTRPYMDVTLGLVVRDHEVRQFRTFESMRKVEDLRIAYVDLSRGFVDRMREILPNAELIRLAESRAFFENDPNGPNRLDVLLISAESGSAFTLIYPQFQVVVPEGERVSLPLFYTIGGNDIELRDFLDHWIHLRKNDGTIQQNYDHWILGQSVYEQRQRWSVIRDVLHWVE
jgi:ABC-type amino acid transport substrate-binding protein